MTDSSPDFSPPAGGLSYYEQFNAAGRCKSSRAPLIVGENDKQKQAIIWQPPCNLWSCPECAPILRARQSVRAYLGAVEILDQGGDVHFLTLTSHPGLTPGQSWWVLPRAWNKLRGRAERKQPGGLFYLVPEHHKSGKAHAHAITNWAMPKKWWKDNAAGCGFGYKADTQIARSGPGAGAYALKYLLKQIHGAPWPKGKRRIMCSQDWPALPEMPGAPDWKFEMLPRDQSLMYTYRFYQESGYEVRLLEAGQRLHEIDRIFGQISLEAADHENSVHHPAI